MFVRQCGILEGVVLALGVGDEGWPIVLPTLLATTPQNMDVGVSTVPYETCCPHLMLLGQVYLIRLLLENRNESATHAWVTAVQSQQINVQKWIQTLAATSSREVHENLERLLEELMHLGDDQATAS